MESHIQIYSQWDKKSVKDGIIMILSMEKNLSTLITDSLDLFLDPVMLENLL